MDSNDWRKASYSNGSGACVEVGHTAGSVAVRDTRDQGGAVLAFAPNAWRRFSVDVKQNAGKP